MIWLMVAEHVAYGECSILLEQTLQEPEQAVILYQPYVAEETQVVRIFVNIDVELAVCRLPWWCLKV